MLSASRRQCFATWPAKQGAWTAPLRRKPPSSLSVCDPSSIGTRRRFVWYCGFHRVEVPYSNFYSMTFSVMQMNLHRGQIMQMRYANEQHNYMQIWEIIVAIKCHRAETRVTRNSTRWSLKLPNWPLSLCGHRQIRNDKLCHHHCHSHLSVWDVRAKTPNSFSPHRP